MELQDLNRLRDIQRKSGGSEQEAIALTRTMTKLITKPDKAYARFLAANVVYGEDHKIGNLFLSRAAELGHTRAIKIKTLMTQISTGESAKKEFERMSSEIHEEISPYTGINAFGMF